ncbi:RimK family alpha-L-glutamate ligase [Aeromicrobium sp. CF4.19]|uniref:ATP-grasp domain-containing protein n=1 Tax=Aeromicrobium sp. CF4.19 TaxID=3373082 RepID=UPI003EE63968
MTDIIWTTGAGFAAFDTDLTLLTAAAARAGLATRVEIWDDADVDWSEPGLVVVRSCWDYVPRREEFLTWARAVPRLQNTADVLAWTTDKTYLRRLADEGVPVVPTSWSPVSSDELPAASEWVVKPTISAGAADTARWQDAGAALAHSDRLVGAGRPSMVQPYVESVDGEGETGLLYFGGRHSHAFRKGALLTRAADPRTLPELKEDIRVREATREQVAFGHDVLSTAARLLDTEPLYARVDVVTGPDGTLQLMELELAEPSFFLEHTDTGAEAMVAAAIERISR